MDRPYDDVMREIDQRALDCAEEQAAYWAREQSRRVDR